MSRRERRATRTVRPNPMQRPASARSWTGSPLSIAAPAMFPPSLLATFDAAFGTLVFGLLIALVAAGSLVAAWRAAGRGRLAWPALLLLVGVAAGLLASFVLIVGVATVDCAPDAYECPM